MDNKVSFKLGQGGAELGAGEGHRLTVNSVTAMRGGLHLHTFISIVISFIPT